MRKQEEAMRIMEALSGVDGELLERCEAAGAGAREGAEARAEAREGAAGAREAAARPAGRNGKRKAFRWQYLSRFAAVLALAVVGAASWRAFWLYGDKAEDGSAGSGLSGSVSQESLALDLEPAPNAFPVEATAAPAGAAINSQPETETEGAEDGFKGSADGVQVIVPGAADKYSVGNQQQAVSGAQQSVTGEKPAVPGGRKEDCLAAPSSRLTAEEAGQIEPLSDYIPVSLPAGYAFVSASYGTLAMPEDFAGQTGASGAKEEACEGPGRLTLLWSKGEDDILLSIQETDSTAETGGTVDVEKPETYDARLYELPYGDTVPEEYREAFMDPVFAKDDFSLEIVRSRVISYPGDGGDTDTPGGWFSVLYDGVLVYFNGRGTPEEIWEMFASMPR